MMLDFDLAQARLIQIAEQVRDAAPAVDAEPCALTQALGRVLAEPITAPRDLPPSDNSGMDGYAVRVEDYVPGRRLPVQQRCYAGDVPEVLRPNHAIRVFTGSPIPPGADAVVIQENCDENNEGVLINTPPEPGQHIRRQGEDVRAGAQIMEAGVRLKAAHVGMIAAQGYARVKVWPKLRIGVLTTGDELIPPGAAASPEKIYDSNGSMLAALVNQVGATVGFATHVTDELDALRAALKQCAQHCDLVLTVGGVSVGERDLVKPALESLGGELDLWKVRMKPGKPVALGRVGKVPVVCLPGNPVSAYAVFTVLVSPVIRVLQKRANILPPVAPATLRAQGRYMNERDEFLRVRASFTEAGQLEVHPYTAQSSGVMSSLPWADGLARLLANTEYQDGDRVTFYPFTTWLD